MSNEEFVDDENPYNEQAREVQLDNEEIDAEEEGFIKGYDETESESDENPDLDDDERMSD